MITETTVTCQHIEDRAVPYIILPIGENRQLYLCEACWRVIENIVKGSK